MTEEVVMVPLWVPILVGVGGLLLGILFSVLLSNFLSAGDLKVIHRKGTTTQGVRYNFIILYRGGDPSADATCWNVEEGRGDSLVVVGPTDPGVVEAVEADDRDLRVKQITATVASGKGGATML